METVRASASFPARCSACGALLVPDVGGGVRLLLAIAGHLALIVGVIASLLLGTFWALSIALVAASLVQYLIKLRSRLRVVSAAQVTRARYLTVIFVVLFVIVGIAASFTS